MVEWNSQVATLCNGTTAASANEEILPKPSKARLHLLIYVHVHLSCACSHTCSCGQSDSDTCMATSWSSFIVHWKVICGIDLRHKHRDELPSYLFIQAFLSITAIISITHSDFEKMKDGFPPIFNLEVATMAMMNVWIVHLLPLISPNLSWQLRYCLPGNLLYNNCYCEISPCF